MTTPSLDTPRLCLITALPAETRPLLDAFRLKQVGGRHLRLFGAGQLLLLETGPGKLSAAAGTAAVLQAYPHIKAIVNIGIAGGRYDYAQTLVAHHVCDKASAAQWYPHLPDHAAFRAVPSASISTLDVPSTHYEPNVLFDMEASGVFNAASRYLSSSQVHSMKVISDNPQYSIETISKHTAKSLILDAVPLIRPMLEVLHDQFIVHDQSVSIEVQNYIERIRQTIHHTVNDQQQLARLVQQYVNLAGDLPDMDTTLHSAKQLRQALRARLADMPFLYGDI